MGIRHVLYCVFAFISANAIAESRTFMDAENPNEAVAMMQTTIHSSAILLDECSKQFPTHASDYSRSRDEWERRERRLIDASNLVWSRVSKENSILLEIEARIKDMVRLRISQYRSADGGKPDGQLFMHCKGYFEDLGSGVWITRTPKKYFYLEEIAGR